MDAAKNDNVNKLSLSLPEEPSPNSEAIEINFHHSKKLLGVVSRRFNPTDTINVFK